MKLSQPALPRKIRVLIADDHELVREGICKVLGRANDVELAGEAASAAEVLWRLQRGDIDLVVLDLMLPGSKDVDLIERIVAGHPKLPILVLTMLGEPHIASRVLGAGALGYLTKGVSSKLLIDAVHHVAQGRGYVDPSLSGALIRSLGTPPKSPTQMAELSAREQQVLAALVRGRTLVDIAADLSLAANTVSTYKARLMQKLRQASLSDLVRYASRHGLAD
jgi:two-component system invasion response regulator UvrY